MDGSDYIYIDRSSTRASSNQVHKAGISGMHWWSGGKYELDSPDQSILSDADYESWMGMYYINDDKKAKHQVFGRKLINIFWKF